LNTCPDGDPATAAEHPVHLDTVEFEGHRYVASADLGVGRSIPLMVHGNARVLLSVVHEVAEELIGRPVPKLDDYGYSARGRGSIDVPVLRLGGATFGPFEGVPVFDFGDVQNAPVQGMLGTNFLTSSRAAVDFASDVLHLGVAASGAPDPAVLARGYQAVRTVALADGRMTIDVAFPSIGRTVPITLSTVANALTLHRPTFEGRVGMRPAGQDHSPSGTSPETFTSENVAFEIEGTPFEAQVSFHDLAEYGNVPEADLQSFGVLGFDWMRAHGAVLDYANQYVYFAT
jgi:hypothetical protein